MVGLNISGEPYFLLQGSNRGGGQLLRKAWPRPSQMARDESPLPTPSGHSHVGLTCRKTCVFRTDEICRQEGAISTQVEVERGAWPRRAPARPQGTALDTQVVPVAWASATFEPVVANRYGTPMSTNSSMNE